MSELEAKHRRQRELWLYATIAAFVLVIIGIFVNLGQWSLGPGGWIFFAALTLYHHGWLRGHAKGKEESDA